MGLFSDFLGRTTVVDTEKPRVAMDRATVQDLTYRMGKRDPDYLPIFDTISESQRIAAFINEVTGGNYTLTVLTHDGETFTTANILYNANAAAILTAIDTAATGNITGWTNGDIAVLNGPLTTTPVTLTFSGTSVTGKNHSATVINDVDLTVDTVGAVTTTQNGIVAEDEVQSIAVFDSTVTGGNYTLEVTLANAETFTTANIAHNANAATIETAIDVAATGNVTAWTNGDITVAGGNLTANPVTLTFDGASVTGANHQLTVIHDIDLVAAKLGAVSTTQNGVVPLNEIQSVARFNSLIVSGNFTLNFTLADATNFVTGNILYSADAATIEAAIDAAATGVVPAWTNGDISVAGGPLTGGPVVLTFDGVSVAEANHALTVIADVDLVPDLFGDVTVSQEGLIFENEQQSIAAYAGTISSGNFTLNFTLATAENFITANIIYNADAATIEAAIDTAATGNVAGWTNGDISVTGGNLTDAAVVLTYDGASVLGANHAAVIIADVDLGGPGSLGVVTTINEGVVGIDEVQSIAVSPSVLTSGNYTLNFTLADSTNFTTGNIAYNANAATIETAIDVAATAKPVPAWTNGDISVSGGDLLTAPIVLTFDGDSVGGNHSLTVIADVDLVADILGAVSTSQNGLVSANEEQGVGAFLNPIASGNYTLNFTLADATNFVTGNIAYNATAAAIETAIDTAANGVVGGWTNGDITVAGGPLSAAPITVVYDGASVDDANHAAVIIADVDLVADTLGTVSVTNEGVVPVNEIQSIADFDGVVTSGNYQITCTTSTPETFTTANILYSANAATIEAAIDAAATGNIGGWVNSDISIAGGPLTTGAVTVTFDGTSVDGANHSTLVITDIDLTAATLGAITTPVHGQEQRLGWALLHEMGIITGEPPVQGTTPTGLVLASTPVTNANWPRPSTLIAIAEQTAIDDNNSEVYDAIMALFNIQE